mmetsp:Transcript_1628/g.3568  ORF Transcript_1628/g.3568 Transcript_1628/m.3568 type:complete len:218 (+) Transcript_1628:552-1205(+)
MKMYRATRAKSATQPAMDRLRVLCTSCNRLVSGCRRSRLLQHTRYCTRSENHPGRKRYPGPEHSIVLQLVTAELGMSIQQSPSSIPTLPRSLATFPITERVGSGKRPSRCSITRADSKSPTVAPHDRAAKVTMSQSPCMSISNGKYFMGRPACDAAAHCNIPFSSGEPLKIPAPQLPVATGIRDKRSSSAANAHAALLSSRNSSGEDNCTCSSWDAS